jgi:autotransporter-associated beta strand protein
MTDKTQTEQAARELTLAELEDANGGDLVKQGTGTLVLAGANTYTGSTNVYSGTTTVTGGTIMVNR